MDTKLLQAISGDVCLSFAQVLAKLAAIEAALSEQDGLRWFNRLYMVMTESVAQHAAQNGFEDVSFLESLDCSFAELYFSALRARLLAPHDEPRAWSPLFDARSDLRVAPVQFALAGVNAHINRDLALALVDSFARVGSAPQRDGARHRDFLLVNTILAEVQDRAKEFLFDPLLDKLDALLGRADDVLELWSLSRARDAAWVAAEVRWQLRVNPILAEQHLTALDRLVGCTGRGLLRA